MASFLDELLRGVGKTASTVMSGTRFGQNMRASEQSDFRNDMLTLQQIQNPQDQQIALSELMTKYPKLVQLQDKMSSVATQTQDQQREAEKWSMLDATEKKDMATRDRWGRRPQTDPQADPMIEGERWMKVAKDASSEELAAKAEKRAEEIFFPPEEKELDADIVSSMLFGPPERQAQGPAQQPTPGHSFAPGAPAQPPQPVDNRGMFADDGPNPFLTPAGQGLLDEDLSPTEPRQSPHTFADIGITQAKQQQEFQELEKLVQGQIPDMDLRQSYALYPESYKKLFTAIQNGVPDQKGGTRKLTTKEIMQAIQSMGR